MSAGSGLRRAEPLLGLLPFAIILAGWQIAATTGAVRPALLPPPLLVGERFAASLVDPAFLAQAGVTLRRLFAGFAVAVILGVPLGLLAASHRVAGAILTPLVRILAPVPKIALYPALVLSLGFADASKVVLVAADAVFPILLATFSGAAAVSPRLVWAARAAGTSAVAAVWKVVLPAALPSILTGCRIGLVVSCIVVFLAEMIASTDGLGHALVRSARAFRTADMFVPLLAISLAGLGLNAALALARRRMLRGFPESS